MILLCMQLFKYYCFASNISHVSVVLMFFCYKPQPSLPTVLLLQALVFFSPLFAQVTNGLISKRLQRLIVAIYFVWLLRPHTLLRKKYSQAPLLVLQLVTDSPGTLFSTWKDHDWNIVIQLGPNIPIMVLPDTIWSFQLLNRVLYLWQSKAPKKVLGSTFFLRVWWGLARDPGQ